MPVPGYPLKWVTIVVCSSSSNVAGPFECCRMLRSQEFAYRTENAGEMDKPSKVEEMFLSRTGRERKTFENDENLPSLPLPDLQHTLSRYLDSLRLLTSPSEFRRSLKIVKAFEKGIGIRLHEKLKQKAAAERNWIEKWWEEHTYLQSRDPLLPFCSMAGFTPKIPLCTYGTPEDQIKIASLITYYTIVYWDLMRHQKLRPNETSDNKTCLSMSQYRRLYNTVRIPGDKVDKLVSYFKTAEEGSCPNNVIIMCKGRIFNTFCTDENGVLITPLEWKQQFEKIVEICEVGNGGQNVGILTCDTRTNWSKNRERLIGISEENEKILQLIEQSLFVVVLDKEAPESTESLVNFHLTGDYNNRWADKAMEYVIYKNGLFGSLGDHTAYDGITSINCLYYVYLAVEEGKDKWKEDVPNGKLPAVNELRFILDKYLEREIIRLNKDTAENKKKVLMVWKTFDDFGKEEIKRLKFHPNSFVQMGLQLAYYRLHRKPAPCYETATTRAYYNGRTETLRSCTPECVQFVKSMFDEGSSCRKRAELLGIAVKRHDELMAEAKANAGCDRHLFGLYCAALEEGIKIPDLYTDPSFFKSGGGGNFVLSTSCIGYTPVGGGVAAMCKNGYGIFYSILPDRINFFISVNPKSYQTSETRYFDSLRKSLTAMRFTVLNSQKKSKL